MSSDDVDSDLEMYMTVLIAIVLSFLSPSRYSPYISSERDTHVSFNAKNQRRQQIRYFNAGFDVSMVSSEEALWTAGASNIVRYRVRIGDNCVRRRGFIEFRVKFCEAAANVAHIIHFGRVVEQGMISVKI